MCNESQAPSTTGTDLAGIEIHGDRNDAHAEILSDAVVAFVADLERRFGSRWRELLSVLVERQARLDAGERPDFLAETRSVRESEWQVAAPAPDLTDRPPRRDHRSRRPEDGDQRAELGRRRLHGGLRRLELAHLDERTRRSGQPTRRIEEKHLFVDGQPMSGSLFDFGLYFFHNAAELVARGSGPYFYLPKMQSHLEARLWNDVFVHAQAALGIANGTVRATVLIEHVLAAFEMEEILYELREHSSGLNCGRWDYIFSFIKCFREDPAFVLPDRGAVGMDRRFLRSYSQLLIQTCHRRGAHAMGGMAAQIPIKNDAEKNAAAMQKVHADKQREAGDGHDGTWVAHPALVAVAREELVAVTGETPNQLERMRADVSVGAEDLLSVPEGAITDAGLRQNLSVGVQYLEAWLRGTGCVPLYHLMEDAATAEISRTQIWQQIRHGAVLNAGLDDERVVTKELVRSVPAEEMQALRTELGDERFDAGRFELAAQLFEDLVLADELGEFLTLVAYQNL